MIYPVPLPDTPKTSCKIKIMPKRRSLIDNQTVSKIIKSDQVRVQKFVNFLSKKLTIWNTMWTKFLQRDFIQIKIQQLEVF